MEKPHKRLWVRLAPKNHNLAEAGLSFPSRYEVVETTDSDVVKDSLRNGRLQMVMSRPLVKPTPGVEA